MFFLLPLHVPPVTTSIRWYYYQDTQGVNRVLQMLVNSTWVPVDENREAL
jgi:hypothetical protein